MVSRRHKGEQEREREKRDRLAYIGTWASGLAHEVRTPLGSIQANADLIEEDLDGLKGKRVALLRERLGRIRGAAESLRRTVDAFLAFARPPRMEFLPTDVREFVHETVEFARPECEAVGIRVEDDLPEEPIFPVLVDRQQFQQVLLNLIANARDQIGEQGTIRVAVRETEEAVEIAVADDAGGVAPEDEEKIFEAFYTTKEGGTGLGLGIARRIAEEHGGTLRLENRPGKGATFVVALPKARILEYSDE